jgi:ABC-type Fe3+ transport system permease subunit
MVTARRAAAWVFVAALSLFLIGPAVALFLVCWWRGELAVLAAPSPADWERWARLLGATIRVTLGAMLLAGALGVTMALAIHRSRGLPRRLLAAPGPARPSFLFPSMAKQAASPCWACAGSPW